MSFDKSFVPVLSCGSKERFATETKVMNSIPCVISSQLTYQRNFTALFCTNNKGFPLRLPAPRPTNQRPRLERPTNDSPRFRWSLLLLLHSLQYNHPSLYCISEQANSSEAAAGVLPSSTPTLTILPKVVVQIIVLLSASFYLYCFTFISIVCTILFPLCPLSNSLILFPPMSQYSLISHSSEEIFQGAYSLCHFALIALQGTTKEPLPQVKLGQTLSFRLFGVCF